jgi:uncharacterized protein YpmS
MQKITFIIGILLTLVIGLTYLALRNRNGETRVSVRDTQTNFTFTASFNPSLTPKLSRYIDSCADELRKDQVELRIQTSEGEVTITADKQLNSSTSLGQLRQMCHSIGKVIIQH